MEKKEGAVRGANLDAFMPPGQNATFYTAQHNIAWFEPIGPLLEGRSRILKAEWQANLPAEVRRLPRVESLRIHRDSAWTRKHRSRSRARKPEESHPAKGISCRVVRRDQNNRS